MANSSSTGAGAPGKSYPHSFQTEAPSLIDGLVQHALVSPSIQIQILSIIDETGSATIGDITAELPDHPDPIGAVMVMVGLNILVLEVCGVLDAHTLVRRADPQPDPDGAGGPVSKVPSGSGSPIVSPAASAIPVGMEHTSL
ncbi:hypothetical protein [Devosia sp. SD17-2]|uniref:hypothetical protein n=1 Tax=Devosia sp. SD17-2 TaxID=2976459 RepID=UPI0023D82086|nr:hypothetical protein [Devosia sp. SD17-2]WEJ34073.1 hypothetical protein NYQ88_04470 [Devosia sp. SD17-2]